MKNGMRYFLSRQQWALHKTAMITFIIMCFSISLPGMVLVPAAFASELTMGEKSTLIYSKEDLQNTLSNVKDKLDAGFPVTTELIFLEDIRNEIKRHLHEVEKIKDELKSVSPGTYGADHELRLEKETDKIKRLIYGLDQIIINPTIKQIDSVLETVEVSEQDVYHKVLANKSLPNKRVVGKPIVFKASVKSRISSEVTEADLAETPEIQFTEEVVKKAEEIGNDITALASWIKNKVDYEPYPWSLKGADGTIADMAGNNIDQSSALIAFYRYFGIPAKYAYGDVKLKIEDLMSWNGGETPEAAIKIFENNSIPVETIYKSGKIDAIRFYHVWVAVFDGHNWRMVDPSFKMYISTQGAGFTVSKEEVDALYNNAATVTLSDDDGEEEKASSFFLDFDAIQTFSEEQQDRYNAEVGTLSEEEVFGKREIVVSEKNNLQPYLARGIIGDRKPAGTFSEVPDSRRAKTNIILPGNVHYNTSLPEIAGKRVSFVYEPVNQEYYDSLIEEYGDRYSIPNPALRVLMKPVLQIDGVTVATGVYSGLGTPGPWLYVGISTQPSTYEYSSKYLRAGNRYNLSMTTQKTTKEELARIAEKALDVIDTCGLSDTDVITDDMIDERLRLSGLLYFSVVDEVSDTMSKILKVVSVNHVSLGFICDEITPVYSWWGTLVKINKGSVHIDVVRSNTCPTSTVGDETKEVAWMGAHGAIGTNNEHGIIEMLYDVKGASTTMVFAEAAKQGLKFIVLDNPDTFYNDISAVSFNPEYSSLIPYIKASVDNGYTVTIPERGVWIKNSEEAEEGWFGYGWTVQNTKTGSGGYMICGGVDPLYSKIINGGSGTTIIAHPLSRYETGALLLVPGLGAIAAGLGKIATATFLYDIVAVTAAKTLAGAAFCIVGSAIGCGLILFGTWALIQIFKAPSVITNLIRRRKDYAYV